MENGFVELENLLTVQESYLENLIKLGLLFENSGQHQKAFDVYKKGLENAEKAVNTIQGTMLGLLD